MYDGVANWLDKVIMQNIPEDVIEENDVAHTKILKIIKEQSFNQMVNSYLIEKYRDE